MAAGPDSYGAFAFGCKDCKVASWTSAGTFGTAVDVPNIKSVSGTINQVSAEQTGDDSIVAVASRAISAEMQLMFGSMSIAALEVMLGLTATSSVSTPNAVKQFKVAAGTKFPYFAVSAVAYSENDNGSMNLFFPKCKISGDVTIGGLEYGMFKDVQITARAVADTTYGLMNIIEQETAVTTAVIPPANIA